MQQLHGIEKPLAVAGLITESEQGDYLALQVNRIQGVPAG